MPKSTLLPSGDTTGAPTVPKASSALMSNTPVADVNSGLSMIFHRYPLKLNILPVKLLTAVEAIMFFRVMAIWL